MLSIEYDDVSPILVVKVWVSLASVGFYLILRDYTLFYETSKSVGKLDTRAYLFYTARIQTIRLGDVVQCCAIAVQSMFD
jgi:hypothetical protein